MPKDLIKSVVFLSSLVAVVAVLKVIDNSTGVFTKAAVKMYQILMG